MTNPELPKDNPPPNVHEMIQSDALASDLLLQMVFGALKESHMPPRPVFEWSLLHVTYNITHLEHFLLTEDREDLKADLIQGVDLLAQLLKVVNDNKMFGLATQVRDILNARKLRYPTHMDLTYGGRLP